MKKKNDHRFWLSLFGTVFLAAGVIFLPRYISRSIDMRALNQVEGSRRGEFSFLEQGSNDLSDAVRAFRNLGTNTENLTLITAVEEPIQINEELLNEVYVQAMTAYEYGMLPWILSGYIEYDESGESESWESWIDQAQFARYYSLTYESEENPNKKELLNFWYLRFSDLQSFDYYFIVNAVNYQIYYAEIHNATAEMMLEEERALNRELYTERGYISESAYMGMMFAQGCMEYHQSMGAGIMEFDFVNQNNLYQKLGIAILYPEGGTPIYIEKSESNRKDTHMYRGICVGFQDLIRWVRLLPEET